MSQPRAERIDQNLRLAAIAAIGLQPLRDQKPKPTESFMFDRRSQVPSNAARNIPYPFRTPLILRAPRPNSIWRSRVNVIGVVTPSPVGVAILN